MSVTMERITPALTGALGALHEHWREYLIEGFLLGLFMLVACATVLLVQHPDSPLRRKMPGIRIRRLLIATVIGLTAFELITSPWGQRSGAHINPSVTLTYFLLGKVTLWDAVFYVAAQFAGAVLGIRAARFLLGPRITHATVKYVVTSPGAWGARAAWASEFVIALVMMGVVLSTSNQATTAPFTPVFVAALVALFIVWVGPISGMSLNPARSLASALAARSYCGLWIYFTAPPLGMVCAAGVYIAVRGIDAVYCAKMDHPHHDGCIFECREVEMPGRAQHP